MGIFFFIVFVIIICAIMYNLRNIKNEQKQHTEQPVEPVNNTSEQIQGKSSVQFSFVAIDIETATPKRTSICQIGLTIVEKSKIVDHRSWYVQPENNEYSPYNIAVHGITPEMTCDAPAFPEVWQELKPYLDRRAVVSHNASFDMDVLKKTLDFYSLEYPSCMYYCSLCVAKRYLDRPSYKLNDLCDYFSINLAHHHDACCDADACALVFISTLSEAKVESLEDITGYYPGAFHENKFMAHTNISSMTTSYIPKVKSTSSKSKSVKDIVGDPNKVKEDSYLFGKQVCFTGEFIYFSREEYWKLIADIGGIPTDSVTRKTNILVVGQPNQFVDENNLTTKQRKAIDLNSNGCEIQIIKENDFIHYFEL